MQLGMWRTPRFLGRMKGLGRVSRLCSTSTWRLALSLGLTEARIVDHMIDVASREPPDFDEVGEEALAPRK